MNVGLSHQHFLSVRRSVRPWVRGSVRPSVRSSVRLSVCPSVRLSVRLSVRPPLPVSMLLSILVKRFGVYPMQDFFYFNPGQIRRMEALILVVSTGYFVVTGNPQNFQSRVHFCEVNITNFC